MFMKYFLFVILISLMTACGQKLTDEEFIQSALDSLDSGDVGKAAIELKNALQQNSRNPEARRLLGFVQYELGDMPGAEKELEIARDLGVADESILPTLSRSLLAQGKYEDLLALPARNLTSGTAKAEVLAAQGLGELLQDNPEAAERFAAAALSADANSVYARVTQARLMAFQKHYDAASQTLEGVLAKDTDFAPAWSLLGGVQESQKLFSEAEASYSKAIENRRANTEDLLNRAMVRIRLQKLDPAQQDVGILLKRVPKHPKVNYAQGLIHLGSGRLDLAKESFGRSLEAGSGQFLPKYFLSAINFRQGNIEQAGVYGEQAFSAAPLSVPIRRLMAAIKMSKGEFKEAEELLRPVVASRTDDVMALNLMASALLGWNKSDQAVLLLEQLVSLQPDSGAAEMRLGAALLTSGKESEGVVHLESALAKDPDLEQARLMLASHFVAEERWGRAMQAAQAYRDHEPDNPVAWNLMGAISFAKGEEENAIRFFTRAIELAPGNPEANHFLAGIAVKAGNVAKARGYYQRVLEQDKGHLQTLLKLAAFDAAENKETDMVSHLKQAIAANPSAIRPRVLLARYYLATGEAGSVAPLMVELGSKDKTDPSVLEVLAGAQLSMRQFSDAKNSLEQLIKQRPGAAEFHFLLSRAHAGKGDAPATEKELRQVVELAPDHLQARLALARLAAIRNQKDKLQEHLAVLEKLAPEELDVLYLKAFSSGAEGDQTKALELLERIFSEAPNTQTMLSLARQKQRYGDLDGALEIQEVWVKSHPEDLLASMALAEGYMQKGDKNQSVVEYERVLSVTKDNVIGLNNIAWYLRDSDPGRALEFAQNAYELAPESPQVLDTLAMVQLSNGQVERASRSIERALRKSPESRVFLYHNAVIKEASGDIHEATRILSELLRDPVQFPERAEAEKMLHRLKSN